MTAHRILHLVTQREPAGAQRVAHQLCTEFRARGHESDVWFLYRRKDAFADAGYRDVLARRPGLLGTAALVPRLARQMRRWRPTAVIAHTHHANVLGSMAARLAKVPRRVIVHHTRAEYESPARRSIVTLVRRTSTATDEVFVSETTRASYGRRATGRGRVIHNGVSPLVDRGARWAGDPRDDPDAEPLVVSIGRLAPQKDHPTLLRAAERLTGVRVVIVGDGDDHDALSAEIADRSLTERVSLAGNVDPGTVAAVLEQSTIVALPSLWEAFGMLVLEAMTAGCALVVSDIPAHREALDDAALYHPVGDDEALARHLRRLIDDPDERARLGAAARRRAQLFTLDRTVDAYLELVGADRTASRPTPEPGSTGTIGEMRAGGPET